MTERDPRSQRPWLKAYELGSTDGWSIEPAPPKRDWMDATFKKIAYRCLPLIAANQAGWVVRCPANFWATWSGKPDNHGVRVVYDSDSAHLAGTAISHFGSGVLTFVLPWLFRTSPGYGLLLRGLTNEVRDNAVPLDAVVETDWSPYTFTMNWKIVRGDVPVRFAKGDAVCMIQPFALELLEQLDCSFEPFAAAPQEIRQGFDDFVNRRSANIAVAPQGQYESQRDYFAGRYPDGSPARYPDGTQVPQPRGCPVADPNASSDAAPANDLAPRHRTGFDLKLFRR
jgi:Family of unknown function (DUF6065)